jgi:hypothetical protein
LARLGRVFSLFNAIGICYKMLMYLFFNFNMYVSLSKCKSFKFFKKKCIHLFWRFLKIQNK